MLSKCKFTQPQRTEYYILGEKLLIVTTRDTPLGPISIEKKILAKILMKILTKNLSKCYNKKFMS